MAMGYHLPPRKVKFTRTDLAAMARAGRIFDGPSSYDYEDQAVEVL